MKKPLTLLSLLIFTLFVSAQEKQDSINDETIEIKEVLIKSQHKRMFSDKAVYTFDKEALDKARYAKDLLNTLPELNIDPITNTIQSTKGGKTLILINGIEATDLQIRSVKPEDVIHVEYYDIPPTRWQNRAEQVVNIMTRNPENGYVFGIDALSSPTTGFVNGAAYTEITRGKNSLGLEYSIEFRDYDNRENTNTYEYSLNENNYKTSETRFDHFGYAFQNILLRYTNTDSDKYTFQARLNLDIFNSFTKVNGSSIFSINNSSENHTTYNHGNNDYTKPTLDLYYSKKIGKKDELSLNFVGSNFTTNTYELSKEWNTITENNVFNNDMILEAKQTGIVGEIAHTHNFKLGKLSSGYRLSNNEIKNDLHNLEGASQYKVNYLEQYVYSEFSGKIKKMNYRLGIGLTNIHNQSEDNSENNWTVTPKLVLGYKLAKNNNIRFSSSYIPSSPWSSALSSNVIQIVPNIVEKGNPKLNIQKIFNNNLIYSFSSDYFDLNTKLFYTYKKDAINQSYILDGDRYALTYENIDNYQNFGLQISGSVKPFASDLLTLKIVLTPASETVKFNEGAKAKNNYLGNNFIISSVYKNFSLRYIVNIPVYTLDGAFLDTNENTNDIILSYKMNNWTFTTGAYWLGMPSEYKSKTLQESLVSRTSHTQIWNNKNMLVFGVSYDFATGKNTKVNRKLENETAGAASF